MALALALGFQDSRNGIAAIPAPVAPTTEVVAIRNRRRPLFTPSVGISIYLQLEDFPAGFVSYMTGFYRGSGSHFTTFADFPAIQKRYFIRKASCETTHLQIECALNLLTRRFKRLLKTLTRAN
jgi:hypothetical protein